MQPGGRVASDQVQVLGDCAKAPVSRGVPHKNTVTEGRGDADSNMVALSEVKQGDYSQIGAGIGTFEGGG